MQCWTATKTHWRLTGKRNCRKPTESSGGRVTRYGYRSVDSTTGIAVAFAELP